MKKLFQLFRIFFAFGLGAVISIAAFLGDPRNQVLFAVTVIFTMAGSYMIMFVFPGIVSKTMKVSRNKDEQV